MTHRSISSEGIILARKNYGEADRLLTIFSRHYGKIFLLAKGVRKLKSRKRSSIEVFSLIKFSASSGDSLDLIIETEVINSFGKIRRSLNKVALTYYFMEIMNKITHDEEENKLFFDHVINYLKRLEYENKLREIKKDFIYQSLVLLGYWPKNKIMNSVEAELESVIEKKLFSERVGRLLVN